MSGYAVCTAHHGRHGVWAGQCVLTGREVRRPFTFRAATCERCGFAVDIRRCVVTGVAETLCAGTDTPHRHPDPIVVTLDPEQLAEAVVSASRAARSDAQRHAQPREAHTAPTEPRPSISAPQTRQEDSSERQIHGVAVVRPE